MRIQVTAEDIAQGIRCSVGYCPIARAVRRATGRPAEVDAVCIRVRLPNTVYGYSFHPVPPQALDFLRQFDAGQPVTPLEIELQEVPQ